MLRQAYAHSLFALTAYDKDVLAGIVQLLGDGASILYVQDLLVRPADQRRGIASELAVPRPGPIPAGISDGAAY